MSTIEIKHADSDIASMYVTGLGGDNVIFVTQIDTGDIRQTILLGQEEARQLRAVLDAYINRKRIHTSDCALHGAPADEVGPCDCSVPHDDVPVKREGA